MLNDKPVDENYDIEGVKDDKYVASEDLSEGKLLRWSTLLVIFSFIVAVGNFIGYHSPIIDGCKVIFFIEYVPVNEETIELAPDDDERDLLLDELELLRKEYDDMLFLSFPGDEKTSGGCLAAGRGFFHINSHGGAEPCPASPYSDINVRDSSLLEALDSKLFKSLRDGGILLDDHEGGCVLFEHKDEVERILNE